jgi:Family of unknown function (DUF5995)
MPSQVDGIAALVARMDVILAQLHAAQDPRRYFLSVYRRMTVAVDEGLADGYFLDPAWVAAWDVAFADLYLAALAADEPSHPWVAAFAAPESMPALRHVLLGMNAHINYDLPQSLLAVIDEHDATDGGLMARRRIDHMRVNQIITDRVRDEDAELAAAGMRSAMDRLLAPLNRIATRRFLTEARRKVWTNTLDLAAARRNGPDSYAAWLERLSALSEQRVRDLTAPGLVLLRLGRNGFGVRLRPADPMRSFDPVVLGVAERDAWAGYYRRDWPAFLPAAWRLMQEAKVMSLPRTALGAWWRTHRNAEHSSDGSAQLTTTWTELYASVFDVPPSSVVPAAQLRAAAMEVSDIWVAAGCPDDSATLDRIRDLLVDSYGELLLAVRRPLPARP